MHPRFVVHVSCVSNLSGNQTETEQHKETDDGRTRVASESVNEGNKAKYSMPNRCLCVSVPCQTDTGLPSRNKLVLTFSLTTLQEIRPEYVRACRHL